MNFSGDQMVWPVYLTIKNLCSQMGNSPSQMAVILVALLPLPPKFMSKKTKTLCAQQATNDEIPDAVFSFIFEPLEAATKYSKEICCLERRVWQCFPVLAALIADPVENNTLHGLQRMSRVVCELPVERLGRDAKEVHPFWHN